MAEQSTVYDLNRLEQQLHTLFSQFTYKDLQADSKPFCSSFCKLVEYYASRWKVPLPQLRILERALCCFTQASVFFTVNCDHVLRTLSSLALSIFELLLFFDQNDFNQDPLKKITVTFQESCSALVKYQNVHLRHVERYLRAGGPWENQTLHAILSESTLPQTEVEECISSEPPVFLELRVRYLLSCQRLPEAQALAKCCAQHPSVGQHLFFYQVYLTGLYKAAHHERLLEELMDFRGKDAVQFLCSLESEENDELLLDFNRAFLSLQLRRGDMHFLCDLVSIWGRLHSRLKSSKAVLLEECEQLILSATNVNAIFPFIRVIMLELSEDGVQFCVELCANALRSCLPCDVITKSLIYKTMASLVPHDLEICRACALLVFFLERSVEAYKMVYILYMHPDQEYHVDCCPIGNRVRFETLQTLKKDLYFDPEFWNLIALRTNCLKLMNEKVLSAALEEIMEEKWVPSYCRKEAILSSSSSKCTKENAGTKKKKWHKGDYQNHKDAKDKDKAPVKKVGRPRINKHLPLKQKGNQGAKKWKNTSSEPMRRSSIWQLDRLHHNRALDSRENKRTTRLSERVPAKRMIRTPKWLLEDSGTLDKNAPLLRRQYPSLPYLPLRKKTVGGKNNTKEKLKSEIDFENDNKLQKEVPTDSQTASNAPQIVVLELSMPDNELLGTFTDETCNRYIGLPQMLFYKPTLKVPSEILPENASNRDEVILKAQDANSFLQLLHCYSRKPKGKKTWTKTQGSSSTITRSSGQVDASNTVRLSDKPTVEMKVTISSQTPQVADKVLRSPKEKHELHEKTAIEKDAEAANEPKVTQSASLPAIAESAMEVEVKVAAQKNRHSPRLEKMTEYTTSKMSSPEKKKDRVSSSLPPVSTNDESQDSVVTNNAVLLNGMPNKEDFLSTENCPVSKDKPSVEDGSTSELEAKNITSQTIRDCINDLPSLTKNIDSQTKMDNTNDSPSLTKNIASQTIRDNTNDSPSLTKNTDSQTTMDYTNNLPSLTLETEIKTEITQNQEALIHALKVDSAPTESKNEEDDSKSSPTSAPPLNMALENCGFDPTEPECEESKLEFCCHFCHKDVKGRLLVAHSMFHYRKDECMFCGVTFRNNLKAIIHLSNHLEKLKKLQNPTSIKSPDKSRTKDNHKKGKAKTSGKLKTVLNEKGRGREKIASVRKLRSGSKFRHDQDDSEDLRSEAPSLKVNGHIGKRKEKVRSAHSLITKTRLRQRSHEIHVKVEKEEPLVISCDQKCKAKKISKQAEINKNIDSCDKLCCPVDGCQWFTVKKQVALLVYHSLEDHFSDIVPLELAFSMTNNKCSICKRVLYSFQHFQHHVERHRFAPRHPCPHKGCTARFKTTFEMRRHARKHSPLQAMCCLPGCPKLFICLWRLILHEKDHYSKRVKDTRKDEPERTQLKQERREDRAIKTSKNKKVSLISIGKSHSNDTNKTKDSTIPKKKISAQSAAATRLLQKLRKRQIVKNNLTQQVTHKRVSSVGKQMNKLRHTLQKKRNRSKEGLSSKVLPPRRAKNSQSNNGKSMESETESKMSIVHQRKEEREKSTDGLQTRPKGKVKEPQKVKMTSTKTIKKRNTNLLNSERTKAAGKASQVVESPVMEENANMVTTNTNYSMAPVSDTQSSNDNSEMEQATYKEDIPTFACQSELSIMSESTSDEYKFIVENVMEVMAHNVEVGRALVVESLDTDSSEKDMIFKVEKCEHEAVADLEHSKQENISKLGSTNSSETPTRNHTTIVSTDIVNEVTPEKVTVDKNSNMPDTISPSIPPVLMPLVQNVVFSQYAEKGESRVGTADNATELPAVTVVQQSEHKVEFMQDSRKENALTKMAGTTMSNTNDTAYESVTKMKKHEHLATDLMVDKMESTDLTANDKPSSSAITSKMGQVEHKDPEIIATESDSMEIFAQNANESALVNTLNSLNEKSVVDEKRNRPKLGNKNEILSALKTLVKSKKDKIENEGKDITLKRKSELDAAVSKKFKRETNDIVAASVVQSSTSEEKTVDATDSAPGINEAPKEKGKVAKIRRKNKGDVKVESSSTNAIVKKQLKTEKKLKNTKKNDKPFKKTKKEKSERKSIKPKSASRKTVAKTSTNPEVSLSGSEGNSRTSTDKDVQCKDVKPKISPEMLDETCLKDHNVFDFVPVEEESPLATFEKALSEYKKKPYMRLPATAYLEERFTVMPKRRKDMSMFFGSSRKVPKSPEATAHVLQQRQRCANCFTTFSTDEELQWHLQQKCSSLFGFESDEEGTS